MKLLDTRKNSKLFYFSRAVFSYLVPDFFLRRLLKRELAGIDKRHDKDEIISRAAYYCKHRLFDSVGLPPDAVAVRNFKMPKRLHANYFETREFVRWFNLDFRFSMFPGDVTEVLPAFPTIVKARPVDATDGNANSIILNLNKVRHFVFVKDKLKFRDKKPIAVFRGKVNDKPKYFGVPGLDL